MTRISTRYRAIPAVLVMAATLLAACGGGKPDYTARDIQGVLPNLAFHLRNENGRAVSARDYAGDLVLLYFGYTNCPDVCPATMARVRAALAGLAKPRRQKIRVLFVSVDPKRDTRRRLKRWTANFGPAFIGLRGSQSQLRTTTKRYHVTYGYGQPNANGFYFVSHSAALYVFDPQGRARLLVRQNETVKQLGRDLKSLIQQVSLAPGNGPSVASAG